MADLGVKPDARVASSLYAPSIALRRFAYGWYGVGHTAQREPGNLRGTVVGKKGRFRSAQYKSGGGRKT
jgi:hypothetical protein